LSEKTLKFIDVAYSYPKGGFSLFIDELTLASDEITFITGDNGSGKTTLAKLMSGVIKPAKGEIILMGRPSGALSLGEIGKMVGYLWQNPRQQLFAQSVSEELTFMEEIKRPKMTREEKEEAFKSAIGRLEYFDLAHLSEKSCFHLSHGERQRLAIAAVIAAGAEYLVLDEPTKGLDAKRKKALADILIKLRDENKTGMSIISHDEEFKAELMERLIRLDKGRIVDE